MLADEQQKRIAAIAINSMVLNLYFDQHGFHSSSHTILVVCENYMKKVYVQESIQ